MYKEREENPFLPEPAAGRKKVEKMKKEKTGLLYTDIDVTEKTDPETDTDTKEACPARKKLRRMAAGYAGLFPIALAIFLMVRFITGPCMVSGISMEDTLHDGDFLLSERTGYHFYDPERFDVVEFYPGEDKSIQYIKRIIGLPGETVQIDKDGRIYINGEELAEEYGKGPMMDAGCASGEGITLGEDEVFCLGDNRNNSLDSRFIGPVKISQIYGHPYFRLFPFTRIGRV